MNCPKCGSEIKENQKFCPKCGAKIQNTENVENNISKEHNKDLNKVNKKMIAIISAVVLVVILVAIVIFTSNSQKHERTIFDINRNDEISESNKIDVFENVNIEFEGWDSQGSITINTDNCSDIIKENVVFSCENNVDGTLSNQQMIIVNASCTDNFMNKYNLDTSDLQSSFEVNGLKKIIESYGFKNDVAWVKTEEKDQQYWALVDKKGTILFKLNNDETPTTNFAENIAIVNRNKLVDKEGNEIWSIENNGWKDAETFFGKDACIEIEILGDFDLNPNATGIDSTIFYGYTFVNFKIETFEVSGSTTGILNKDGEWYIKPDISNGHTFSGDGKCGVYDAESNYVFNLFLNKFVDNSFNNTENASEKIANWEKDYKAKIYQNLFFNGDRHYSYGTADNCFFEDKNGKRVIDLDDSYEFGSTYNPYFVGDYCLLDFQNGYYSVIDKKGNFMFEPKKQADHGNISCDLFWVKSDEMYEFINVKGEKAFDVNFNNVNDFSNDMALVSLNENLHFINTDGKIIF